MSNEIVKDNQCSGNEYKQICMNNNCDYQYKQKIYYPSSECPPGYAKIGINCLKTENKEKLSNPEKYDENNDIVMLFDINKKKVIPTPDIITKKYLVKDCPLFHPEEKELVLDIGSSDKDITTTNRKCKYIKVKGRGTYKKDDCYQHCDNGDDNIKCGNAPEYTCKELRKNPDLNRGCYDFCQKYNKSDSDICNISERYKQCFIDQYGPSAKGWHPSSSSCPPGWRSTGSLTCQQECSVVRPGWTQDFAGTCWSPVPEGFVDTGWLYREKCIDGYNEVAGVCWRNDGVWTDCHNFGSFGTIPNLCPADAARDMYGNCWAWLLRPDCDKKEYVAGLCYDKKCPPNWHRTAACSCEGNGNPSGKQTLSNGNIRYTTGRTGLSYVPPTYPRESHIPNIQGIHNCQLKYGTEGFFNTLGQVLKAGAEWVSGDEKAAATYANSANEMGPLICGKKCPDGYKSDGYMCKREREFDLCYPERQIDMDDPAKIWKKYCSTGNNISGGANNDMECISAVEEGKLSQKDYNDIYIEKCKDKMDTTILAETNNVFKDGKSKNKLLYTTLAQICHQKNIVSIQRPIKPVSELNLTPNSYYKLNIALPILNLDKQIDFIINSKDLDDAFQKYDLIIDRDIIKALDKGEFICIYEEIKCKDNVKAYYITFIRIKYGSIDDDCCLNMDNTTLDGLSVNYFNDINSELINPSEINRINYYSDLFGSKQSCDPKFKKMEGGNEICRTALNDFCSDTNNDGVPHILEFTDTTQTNLKHKRCGIDFQKKYKSDYIDTLKYYCNDYNEYEKKTFIKNNKICKDYCKDDMSNCMEGYEKYCIEKDIFGEECKEFIRKMPHKDKIYEKMCVLTPNSKVYDTTECKDYRDQYTKCLVNEKGNSNCDIFYADNTNITAKIFNKDCNKNPTLKYCDKEIIQYDMYKNKYNSTANKKEAANNIIKSNPKKYVNTSEENIIKNRTIQIENELIREKIKYCLDSKNESEECKKKIEDYMQAEFVTDCIKGIKDSFENNEYCIEIKNSEKSNFKKYIRKYCNDIDSAAYNTTECINFKNTEQIKKNNSKIQYIIFGIIVFFILISISAIILSI
jgi:hypothetical protein